MQSPPEQRSVVNRREFLERSALVGAGLLATMTEKRVKAKDAPGERLSVAVIGISTGVSGGSGRGLALATGLASLPGAEVACVCDVDTRNVANAVAAIGKRQAKPPRGVGDFRRVLDDKSIDAVAIATPDHWHAPLALLALSAGKHVYVEKPCCHNLQEGEWLVAAAGKQKRIVQHGTQRRTWPAIRDAIARVHAGDIGRVLLAKCWYFNNRPTIGHGKEIPVPEWLDYSLWQGPAPARPYRDNILHYNWHWFWHWGTGELGNNGVHTLDVARWGMNVDCPLRVTSAGGKYRYDDDQETPDTNTVIFDYGDRAITWENRSWAANMPDDPQYDVGFFGEKGSILIKGVGYTVHDPAGKEIAKGTDAGGDASHLQNFIDAVRGNATLNAEITEGFKSARLCHYGNISWRTGRALRLEPTTGKILDDKEAMALWGREYGTKFQVNG